MAYIEIQGRKIEGVIFDLDGTLVDSIADIGDSMNRVMLHMNFPTHTYADYRYFVGKGLRELIINAVPEAHRQDHIIDECYRLMNKDYGNNYINKTKAYDGIESLVSRLKEKDIKLAVLSNKLEEMTRKVVVELLEESTFEMVMGLNQEIPRKPDPQGAMFISRQWKIKPENIAYVGDTSTDMQTAKNAGMIAIGALWGFRTKEELVEHGADILLKHPLDLLKNSH
ncbi:MAG: HAD family hydrolase [Bacteroidales bacterium]|nr:HAD family hydrolase [Bacteroidales bacterium]MCF8399489.1 HAD family hydrolase [Bacteroidales bacterium]